MAVATPEELASYMQQDLDRATAELLLQLTEDTVTDVLGPVADWTAAQSSRVKRVGLEVAARAYRNPGGAKSRSVTTGPYSESISYDTGGAAAAGVYLTDAEVARLLGPTEGASAAAQVGTIRLAPGLSPGWTESYNFPRRSW